MRVGEFKNRSWNVVAVQRGCLGAGATYPIISAIDVSDYILEVLEASESQGV